MKHAWVQRVGLAALAAMATACATAGPAGVEEAQEELDRGRRTWAASGPEEYRYTLRRICFCGQEVTQPVEVDVRGGEVVARRVAATGEPVSPTFETLWPTVEGLFDLVQDAIDREADRLTVRYDPDRGYPTSIDVDYSFQTADEELGITVGEVRPLP